MTSLRKGHTAYQSIRVVGVITSTYVCFHRSSLSLSKLTAEKLLVTFHDLKLSQGHEEGSLLCYACYAYPAFAHAL